MQKDVFNFRNVRSQIEDTDNRLGDGATGIRVKTNIEVTLCLPDYALPHTFEEAQCALAFRTFYRFHLQTIVNEVYDEWVQRTTTPSIALATLLASASPPAVTP